MPLTVSHAKSITIADGTNTSIVRPGDWNSAHSYTLSLTGSEIGSLFAGASGVSLSSNTSGITIGMASVDFFEPFILPNTNSTLSAPGIGTWYFDPVQLQQCLGSGQLMMPVSNGAGFKQGSVFSAASTGSASKVQTFYDQLAIYGRGSGANSTRLESLWTGNCSILVTQSLNLTAPSTSSIALTNAMTASFPAQWDVSGGVTYSSTSSSQSTGVGASTAASTAADNAISAIAAFLTGARIDIFPLTQTLSPDAYWFAHMFTSTSSAAGAGAGSNVLTAGTMMSTHSRLGMLEAPLNGYKRLGKSVSDASSNMPPFNGFLATTSSQASASVGTADIRGSSGRFYWNYLQSSY